MEDTGDEDSWNSQDDEISDYEGGGGAEDGEEDIDEGGDLTAGQGSGAADKRRPGPLQAAGRDEAGRAAGGDGAGREAAAPRKGGIPPKKIA